MALDIYRSIEIKHRDGTWHRVKINKTPVQPTPGRTEIDVDNNLYGQGYSIWPEFADEHTHYGLPEDYDKTYKELYEAWGSAYRWATLSEIEAALKHRKQKLFDVIKEASLKSSQEKMFVFLQKTVETLLNNKEQTEDIAELKKQFQEFNKLLKRDYDDYYDYEYPWSDFTITNKFEDEVACAIDSFDTMNEEYNVIYFILSEAEDCALAKVYDSKDIRVIYLYNR